MVTDVSKEHNVFKVKQSKKITVFGPFLTCLAPKMRAVISFETLNIITLRQDVVFPEDFNLKLTVVTTSNTQSYYLLIYYTLVIK
jgi:hypothetical protein